MQLFYFDSWVLQVDVAQKKFLVMPNINFIDPYLKSCSTTEPVMTNFEAISLLYINTSVLYLTLTSREIKDYMHWGSNRLLIFLFPKKFFPQFPF